MTWFGFWLFNELVGLFWLLGFLIGQQRLVMSVFLQVFELLISFCTLKPQRSFMCRRLFDHIITSEQQLSIMSGQLPRSDFHPLLATVYWSVLPLTRSQHASRAALDFLTEMYEVRRLT